MGISELGGMSNRDHPRPRDRTENDRVTEPIKPRSLPPVMPDWLVSPEVPTQRKLVDTYLRPATPDDAEPDGAATKSIEPIATDAEDTKPKPEPIEPTTSEADQPTQPVADSIEPAEPDAEHNEPPLTDEPDDSMANADVLEPMARAEHSPLTDRSRAVGEPVESQIWAKTHYATWGRPRYNAELNARAHEPTPARKPPEPVRAQGIGEPSSEFSAVDTSSLRTETSIDLKATQKLVTPSDREFFRRQSEILTTSTDEARKQKAADDTWAFAATIVTKSVALESERRALRQGLVQWVNSGLMPELRTDAGPKEHWLVDWFFAKLREVLKALTKEALVELLLPGVHFIGPPTGLVDAVFAAIKLLELAEAR